MSDLCKWIGLACCVMAFGSSTRAGAQDSATSDPAAKPAPAADTGAVTRAEAEALAKRIDTAAVRGDFSAYSNAFDDAALLERALKGVALTPRARAALAAMPDFSDQLAHGLRVNCGPGKFRLVRVIASPEGGEPRLLFRAPRPSLDYQELHLSRDASGAVKVVDCKGFRLVELFSELLRARLLPTLAQDGVQLTAEQQETADAEVARQRVAALVQREQYAAAMAALEKLPERAKARPSSASYKLAATSSLGPEAFAAAEAEFRKRYPDEPAVELFAIDAILEWGDYKRLPAALDRLAKRVGDDRYLDVFRADAAAGMGDYERCRALLRKLIMDEPSLPDAYESLAVYALHAGEFADVASTMIAGTRDAGIRWSELEEMEQFAEFKKSDEYAKVKAAQAAAARPKPAVAPKGAARD